jgi:2-C-methyl-D-erythritol 4-phosphate cytidylyltransferase
VPDHSPHRVVALVLAGGTGSRMGYPKQFINLLGMPALLYTLRAFEEARGVTRVYVVGDAERIERLAREVGMSRYAGCSPPGESRSLSTRNGLSLLDREDPETVVLVHDGSRCLVTPKLVERVIGVARDGSADGVIPALPVSDTIKVVADGAVVETLDRAKLHAVQTPQAFRIGLLRKLCTGSENCLHSATDEASLVEAAGGRVLVVRGEKTNIKLTTPEDLIFAEAILKARLGSRTGA